MFPRQNWSTEERIGNHLHAGFKMACWQNMPEQFQAAVWEQLRIKIGDAGALA
jgi:hypothetical protein